MIGSANLNRWFLSNRITVELSEKFIQLLSPVTIEWHNTQLFPANVVDDKYVNVALDAACWNLLLCGDSVMCFSRCQSINIYIYIIYIFVSMLEVSPPTSSNWWGPFLKYMKSPFALPRTMASQTLSTFGLAFITLLWTANLNWLHIGLSCPPSMALNQQGNRNPLTWQDSKSSPREIAEGNLPVYRTWK